MTERHVGTGQQYADIAKAHTAASPGDTIVVHDGEYFHESTCAITKSGLTIQNYPGHTPVITGRIDTTGYTGGKPNNAGPSGVWTNNVSDYQGVLYGYKHAALIWIKPEAHNVTIDGLIIERSAGRGISIGNDQANSNGRKDANNFTMKNSIIRDCRGAAVVVLYSDNAHFEDTNFERCVNFYAYPRGYSAHPGCVGGRGATDLSFLRCNWIENAGETLMFDYNTGGADGLTVTQCLFQNGQQMQVYLHDAINITIEESMFIGTTEAKYFAGKYWSGIVIKGCEDQYYDKGEEWYPKNKGVKNVVIRNNLFLNMPNQILNGGPAQAVNAALTSVENVLVTGNTFIQTTGRNIIAGGGQPIAYKNIRYYGNAFYTTGDPSSYAVSLKSTQQFDWKNNYFNKQPIPATCVSNTNVFGGNMYLKNVLHKALVDNWDADNYKIVDANSVLIGEFIDPPTYDGNGNTRSVPSDLGWHDYDAGPVPPPDDEPPTAAFTIKVGGIDIGREVVLESQLDFASTSSAGSGFTITGYSWELTLQNTTVKVSNTNSSWNYTPTIEGSYLLTLEVTQSDGQISSAGKIFKMVKEVTTEPPPEPPPIDTCFLNTWTAAIKSGSPKMETSLVGERTIVCASGSAGWWYSWWGGVITPSTDIVVSMSYKQVTTSGGGAVVILYYNGNTLLSSSSFTLSDSATYTSFSQTVSVPASTNKIRFDVRLWSSVGQITFKDACIKPSSASAPPTADIVAEIDSVEISIADEVPINSTVDFDGTGSTAGAGETITSYRWTIYKGTVFMAPVGEPVYTSTMSYNFGTAGSYLVRLQVGQSDDQYHYTDFRFSVVGSVGEAYIWAEKYLQSYGETGPISGAPPLYLQLVAYASTLDLQQEINYYVWEIFDSNRDVIITVQSDNILQVTFPPPEAPLETIFGFRVVAYTFSGTTYTHVEYETIEVIEEDIVVIGPSTPGTLSGSTDNVISGENVQYHKIQTTTEGKALEIPLIGEEGDLFLKALAVNWSVWSGLELPSFGPGMPWSLSLLGGIIFKQLGLIQAQELNFASNIVKFIGSLPTSDPLVDGQVWLNNNVLTMSVGSGGDPEPPPDETETFVKSISAGADDAVETATGIVDFDSNILRLEPDQPNVRVGLRFQSVTIPQGSTIVNVLLKVNLISAGTYFYVDVGCENVDSSAAITETANNLTGRTATSLVTVDQSGVTGWNTFTLPTAPFQTVINRGGWASGNNLMVVLDYIDGTPTSDLAIMSYDYNTALCAELTIEYS